jgi:exodeoxyribonuclease VII large subunit
MPIRIFAGDQNFESSEVEPYEQYSSKVFSVGEITKRIKSMLETGFLSIMVEGEISNSKLASSGHLYFSLKDKDALIQAVMFKYKYDSVDFDAKDGVKVIVKASLSVYEPRGQYQLIVQTMRRSGVGDILATLEERKRKLAAEGLFDLNKKRTLPRLPSRIAVITSPGGAAIRDIIHILKRRNSGIQVLIFPTLVQGDEAADQISKRISQASGFDGIDVIILARGGGSIEDLLAFSDEKVVRAIAKSRIPVISAVGHETDWSLSDFAADLRAPTPSAAAEIVAESQATLMHEIEQQSQVIAASMRARIEYARSCLSVFSKEDGEAHFLRSFLPIARRCDDARDDILRAMRDRFATILSRLTLCSASLELASPKAILERGFSIVRELPNGELSNSLVGNGPIVRNSEKLIPDMVLGIYFSSGKAKVEVKGVIKE